MATIPKVLHEHINTAFPANVCLAGTVLPSGFAQVSSRGSLVQPEKERDPDKKGFAVLIKVDRAEDLDGQPLPLP